MTPGPSCAIPAPLSATVAGLPAALWATDREADFGPTDDGVNVTVIVRLFPAATVAVVGDTLNWSASVPVTVMPAIDKTPSPVLLTVNDFLDVASTFVLSIVREMADRLMDGKPTPIPLRGTDEGLPAALWAMDREADFGPTEVGAKVTVIVRLPHAAIVAVVGDTLNCEESGPVTAMPEMERLALPMLLILNVF
ncbi:MAG: hypothetical protein A3F84_27075 [Candidatus Handelsmanbacteria bacterium RIFCSPLOWO2_12_FULL_64_10]|uniref:Uncharacterized protein n=1 Tax=Handelsmanbacteria sp. (strain RIFCSPLOWO2_12_FULL_64_10) TaxID=1817868 RepID=A0A1F6C8J4_HANXR|nr:MAG: hypothetical protein A3F84_27075 [Candidatus Handelsmanbacteria bacterium RIFCSPLOWO2_12_FULL_64_10]